MREDKLMVWSLITIFIIVAVVSWAVTPTDTTDQFSSTDMGGTGLAVWQNFRVRYNACVDSGVEITLLKGRTFRMCQSTTTFTFLKYTAAQGCLVNVVEPRFGSISQYFHLLEPVPFGEYTFAITSMNYGLCKIRVTKIQK